MRSLTKSDKERGRKLREIGCIVCSHHFGQETPAAIHHISGKSKPGSHKETIPLCGPHHQIPSNSNEWVSRHGDGRAAFESEYGTEQYLLELTNEMIGD